MVGSETDTAVHFRLPVSFFIGQVKSQAERIVELRDLAVKQLSTLNNISKEALPKVKNNQLENGKDKQ